MSELPRVRRATGGPRELSMPWPLCEAGGRRVPGERGSWVGTAGGGEKYEADVSDEAEQGAVGVEGLEARRERVDAEGAVEVTDGKRSSVGRSGAVWVRWCLAAAGLDEDAAACAVLEEEVGGAG